MRLFLALLLTCLAADAQTSYFNTGFLRQGNALLDRTYLGVTNFNAGANITFTSIGPGLLEISAVGGGGPPGPPGPAGPAGPPGTNAVSTNDLYAMGLASTNFTLLTAAALTNYINLTSNAIMSGLADADTNSVLKSPLLNGPFTNAFSATYGTTNVLPWTITNYAGASFGVSNGIPVLVYSTDNGVTWSLGAEILVTTTPVKLAVTDQVSMGAPPPLGFVGTASAITNLQTYVMSRPDLYGKTNTLTGQSTRVGWAVLPDEVVPYAQAQSLLANSGWQNASDNVQLNGFVFNASQSWNFQAPVVGATNSDSLKIQWLNSDVLTFTAAAPAGATLHNVWLTGTNVNILIYSNGIASSPFAQVTHKLKPINWAWQATPSNSYPQTVTVPGKGTNDYMLSFPMPFPDQAFFRVVVPSAIPTVATLTGVLRMTPLTITNSTDTTFGLGAGLICGNSNYLYFSVGTNLWKRASLTTW